MTGTDAVEHPGPQCSLKYPLLGLHIDFEAEHVTAARAQIEALLAQALTAAASATEPRMALWEMGHAVYRQLQALPVRGLQWRGPTWHNLPCHDWMLPSGGTSQTALSDHVLLGSAIAHGLAVQYLHEQECAGQTFHLAGALSSEDLPLLLQTVALTLDLFPVMALDTVLARLTPLLGEEVGVLYHRLLSVPYADPLTLLSPVEQLLCLAHLCASPRLEPDWGTLTTHPVLVLETALFGPEVKPLSLVSVDVDAIKDYIFDTSNLFIIQGASERINRISRQEFFLDGQPGSLLSLPESLVYAGGGTALLLVPAVHGQHLPAEIEQRGSDALDIATLTAVALDVRPSELLFGLAPASFGALWSTPATRAVLDQVQETFGPRGKSFGELFARLALQLRCRKEEKGQYPFVPVPALAERCTFCLERPAETWKQRPDGPRMLCSPCLQRFQEGEYARGKRAAESLQEIGQDSDGYVGVLSADGNDMTGKLEGLETLTDYRRFSQHVRQLFQTALEAAVAGRVERRQYQGIIAGGDDLLVIVPGKAAAEVALALMQHIEELSGQSSGQPAVTLGVGLIIAKASYPIYFLMHLAEQLKKEAKREAYTTPRQSTIDFLILKSSTPLSTSIKAYRERYLRGGVMEAQREFLRLTERPYPTAGFRALIETIRQLQGTQEGERAFPRSQLYALREAVLQGGYVETTLQYLRQSARREHYARLTEGLRRVRVALAPGDKDSLPLWRKTPRERRTALLDILELYDFVAGAEEA
jgi:hypothetical protein